MNSVLRRGMGRRSGVAGIAIADILRTLQNPQYDPREFPISLEADSDSPARCSAAARVRCNLFLISDK